MINDIIASNQTNIIASAIHFVRNQCGLAVDAVTIHHSIVLFVQNHGKPNDDGDAISAKALI